LADIAWPADGSIIYLANRDGKWTAAEKLPAIQKTLARSGPFKQAFNHRMMFVYGTAGSAEENAWAFAKARFDAETFWYRGNGSVDVIADSEFDSRDAANRDRSVILYGNADTNSTWDMLLHDSPVQVKRDAITIGDRQFTANNLAC